MSTRARVGTLVGGLTVLALVLVLARTGNAGGEKDLAASIENIAAKIEQGDTAAAGKMAKMLAKDTELEDVMHLFRPRKKKGIGVGKAGAIIPDGIEQQFIKLGRDAPSQGGLNKEAAALEHMGYITAAVAEFTLVKTPEKDMGNKTVKEWTKHAKEMREASVAFAEAAKSKAPAAVYKAAERVNGACNSCHSVFRD